jgi:hypothetical protein
MPPSELEQLMLQNSNKDKVEGVVNPSSEETKDEESIKLNLSEFGKQMKLIETNANEPNISSYTNTDWSVNKRAYKHKVYVHQIRQTRGFLEHEMLFSLSSVVSIREIQIGFINYW